jgi:hypothetical protein
MNIKFIIDIIFDPEFPKNINPLKLKNSKETQLAKDMMIKNCNIGFDAKVKR